MRPALTRGGDNRDTHTLPTDYRHIGSNKMLTNFRLSGESCFVGPIEENNNNKRNQNSTLF